MKERTGEGKGQEMGEKGIWETWGHNMTSCAPIAFVPRLRYRCSTPLKGLGLRGHPELIVRGVSVTEHSDEY